jgi:hypothetical protein
MFYDITKCATSLRLRSCRGANFEVPQLREKMFNPKTKTSGRVEALSTRDSMPKDPPCYQLVREE